MSFGKKERETIYEHVKYSQILFRVFLQYFIEFSLDKHICKKALKAIDEV